MSMAAEIKPVENPGDYDPWFEAVSSGDWCKAKVFLTQHPSAITATDSFGDTALHNAVFAWHEQIVEELVQLMTEEQLETKNKWGLTALAIAAGEENIKMVECLVAKNKKLLGIADHNQMTPILIAAENHRWDIVRYLYSQTPLEDLKPDKGPCGSQLVIYCLQAKQFDIVLKLLDYCPALGYAKGFESYPIYEFALLPSAFPSGTSLKFWQRWIYKYIHVEHAPSVSDARINVQNQENEQGDQRNSTGINRIRDLKLLHVRSLEILDSTCDEIKHLNNEEMMRYKPYEIVFNAVENGIVEIVISLCKAKPELLVKKRRREGQNKESIFPESIFQESIFHYAVECRQEKVYSLIYGAGKRNYLATFKNSRVERMLYYAGMLSPLAKEKLDRISGPALQMQRERQWYKEVESFVVTATGASPFEEHILTAARLFTQNHEELHKKGEKWMKATSSSYTVVNALIVTIMFAAAFTVPGGNNPETGYPIFLNKKLFMVFIVSDAISLFSSATSALMFLGIHISRYAEDDFLTFLPTKMITGIFTLFISILAMMVAFSSALFIMLQHKSLIITPIIAFASVPVIYFIWMHFPLLFEILLSTYGGGLFNKKCKRWINV
ncbi:uncharacterized protein LOC126610486 isoform X4 [Malus sylvestris]|uniref:uncharacterized protein LOC126610486 isoform X4 n=1 Tax=Malus sylvestris TaxID=3752 RepID=UPI0021AC9E9C|nr:uncharacterized protein LOC126610486 isoform X4 [Malus sylvestris]